MIFISAYNIIQVPGFLTPDVFFQVEGVPKHNTTGLLFPFPQLSTLPKMRDSFTTEFKSRTWHL